MVLLNSLALFALAVSRTLVELIFTHCRSEFFSRGEQIQWNYSCAIIRISHKQFLAKNFTGVESGLYKALHNGRSRQLIKFKLRNSIIG